MTRWLARFAVVAAAFLSSCSDGLPHPTVEQHLAVMRRVAFEEKFALELHSILAADTALRVVEHLSSKQGKGEVERVLALGVEELQRNDPIVEHVPGPSEAWSCDREFVVIQGRAWLANAPPERRAAFERVVAEANKLPLLTALAVERITPDYVQLFTESVKGALESDERKAAAKKLAGTLVEHVAVPLLLDAQNRRAFEESMTLAEYQGLMGTLRSRQAARDFYLARMTYLRRAIERAGAERREQAPKK